MALNDVPDLGMGMMGDVAAPMAPAMPAMVPEPIEGGGGESGSKDIPDQFGIYDSGKGKGMGFIMFDDMFPHIELDEDDREKLVAWFERDLRSSVRAVESNVRDWAKWRAVYMMEYWERCFPDLGIGAEFSSGVLCEKMLEGIDRLKRSVSGSWPLFAPDPKRSGSDEKIDVLLRSQWFMHSVLVDQLEVLDTIGDETYFDFLLDGSAVVEVDTMYEKIPQRTIRTYTDVESLVADEEKAIDGKRYQEALYDMQTNGVARMLIEDDIVTKNGLQVFHVDKVDHLVPDGVYTDRGIRFRARRMYLTSADIRLMASDDVGWYDQDAVDKVLNARSEARGFLNASTAGNGNESTAKAQESLRPFEENYDLQYGWKEEDLTNTAGQPYEEVFAVYRVTCKYGYTTKSDPKGKIPKYCVMDYSPEGKQILRAVTYPHFLEKPNWFHFKLGYAPRSYYGFGYGRRIVQDDLLESNVVNLFIETATLNGFGAFLARHPESGGIGNPWPYGYGPAKVGYLNDPLSDFKQVDTRPPSDALLRHILPLTQTRAANKTSVTSLTQGRTESSDPRSPAQKTALLLGQANIGMEVMIGDWNRTGWNPLANFLWSSIYENAVFVHSEGGSLESLFDGLVVKTPEELGTADNKVTLDELKARLVWASLASSDYLNPEVRIEKFTRLFMFFIPILRELAQFDPDMYKKYVMRWLRRASQEMDVAGASYLIPSESDLQAMPADRLGSSLENVMSQLKSGQGPQMIGGAGGSSAAGGNAGGGQ